MKKGNEMEVRSTLCSFSRRSRLDSQGFFARFPRFTEYLKPFLYDIQPNCRADDEINEAESCKQNSQTGENDREVGYHVHSRENPGGAQMHSLITVLAQKV